MLHNMQPEKDGNILNKRLNTFPKLSQTRIEPRKSYHTNFAQYILFFPKYISTTSFHRPFYVDGTCNLISFHFNECFHLLSRPLRVYVPSVTSGCPVRYGHF